MTDLDASLPQSSSDSPTWEEVETELGQIVANLEGTVLNLPTADPATWEAIEQELGDLIVDFQDLQDDLTYRRAQEALGSLVQRLNLTPREQAGVEAALQNLRGLKDKLEHTVIHIAAFGLVGRGKSSLLNALMGQEVFTTGPTHGVTQMVEGSAWRLNPDPIAPDDKFSHLRRASLHSVGQSRIELIDTPGLDEVDGEDRAALARRIAEQVDLILFVIAGDVTRVEYEALQALRQASKPMLLVFNKVDQYPEADRQVLYEALRDRRLQDLISPDEIVMAAAAPLAVQVIPQPDGSVTHQTVRSQPQVDELKLKILDVLHREGKALVALNTLMYADGVSANILERKRQICDRIAEDTVWNATMIKAVAVALNPITLADLVGGTVIDVMLILNLSQLYGLPMTRPAALKLLQQIALGLGGITISELIITLGLSSLKGVLGVSAVATGGLAIAPYIPVALAQGGVAGLSTYGIGQITKAYLTKGATWGPNGPRAIIGEILDNLDEASILNRIKAELRAKITP